MSGFYLNTPSDYLTSIEDALSTAMGKPYRTSPVEWALMTEWEAKVPLHVVLRVISDVVKKDVRSLAYCRSAVEKAFQEYISNQVGRSPINNDVPLISCLECNDLKRVWTTDENAEFEWMLKEIPCPDCGKGI